MSAIVRFMMATVINVIYFRKLMAEICYCDVVCSLNYIIISHIVLVISFFLQLTYFSKMILALCKIIIYW